MGKKVKKVNDKTQAQAHEAEAPKTEAKAEAKPKHAVWALEFLRRQNLEWVLERPLEPGDLTILNAQVRASEGGEEWASWFIPYHKADGSPVKGIVWVASAPLSGGYLVLRLLDSGKAKATLRVWPSGKCLITGSEPVVKALLARPDIRPWTDEDTAALL